MRSDVSKFDLDAYSGTADGLARLLSIYSGVKIKDCIKVMQVLPSVVYDQMVAGNECDIRGLCTFYTSKTKPKEGIRFGGERVLFNEGLTVRCKIKDNFKHKFKKEFREARKRNDKQKD